MNNSGKWNDLRGSVLNSNGFLLFLLVCLLQWLFVYIRLEFVVTNELYDEYVDARMRDKYDDYEKLASEFEDDLADIEDDEYLMDYFYDFVFILLQNLIQFTVTAAFIFIWVSLVSDTEGLLYKPILKAVIVAHVIFFIPLLIKYLWFAFQSEYSYLDVKNFHPFSLLVFFDPDQLPDWMIYPLKVVNIFEIVFVWILINNTSYLSGQPKSRLIKPIVLSYSTMLILWISVRIYLSVLF